MRRFPGDISIFRRRILVDNVQSWTILSAERGLERSSLAELDPRPLFSLRSHRIDAKEKHLHTLLAGNFHELSRIVRREIEVQLTQVRTHFQWADQGAIDRDAQF